MAYAELVRPPMVCLGDTFKLTDLLLVTGRTSRTGIFFYSKSTSARYCWQVVFLESIVCIVYLRRLELCAPTRK